MGEIALKGTRSLIDQSDPGNRETLRLAISDKSRRIRDLSNELVAARLELVRLEKELASVEKGVAARPPGLANLPRVAPATAEGRVQLFRSLFRGREDLHALMWTNRAGRTGYSPACENKWLPGVCNIRTVPCGQCPNQAFVPMAERAIYRHLAGPDVIGLYPLLPDGRCWLLAVDFDKKGWSRDVAAYRDACRSQGVPVAIERSRSGNGAHAWTFFSEPVSAVSARRMGSFLLTQAMSARHSLDFSSYDRLFPNQDTLPKGRFGNLIALPLQHEPRNSGNTVFVDDNFEPFPDQWGLLAGIGRMSAADVDSIAERALESGQVLGLGSSDTKLEIALRRRLGASQDSTESIGPLPEHLELVLDSKLRVPKAGLPSSILSGLKRLAAFQNPEFYKRERMRLSVALTPRVIRCFQEDRTHIALPRGCKDAAAELLRAGGVKTSLTDRRDSGSKINVKFLGALTAGQDESSRALQDCELGILVSPPGSGKTVVAISLIAARGRNTLVIVNRQHLMDQWVKQLALFLDIDPKEVGRIGGGADHGTGRIDVAMVQSLVRKGEVSDAIDGYGQVVVDECHHVPAFSFERALSKVRARYILGLTATPKRRDGLQPIALMQLGAIAWTSKEDPMGGDSAVTRKLIIRETGFKYSGPESDPPIHAVYEALQSDHRRNDLIVDDVARALAEGRSPIVLTERLMHLDLLEERFSEFARHVVVLKGGVTAARRRRVLDSLADIPKSQPRVLVATGKYVGEGFDDPSLDTLFLTMPISWSGRVVQYAGRLNRPHPGKTELRIYDYAENDVPMLAAMLRRRLAGYRTVGYSSA